MKSTNLGLLQSNMTYMYKKWVATYHWVSELYCQLKLPLYEGLQEHLEIQNRALRLSENKSNKGEGSN